MSHYKKSPTGSEVLGGSVTSVSSSLIVELLQMKSKIRNTLISSSMQRY